MPKFDIDGDLVRKLAGLLDETGLGEIEFEADGRRIRVVRPVAGAPVVAAAPAAASAPAAVPGVAPAPVDEASHPGAVVSPMVGTVYMAPSPEDPPFCKVGDNVQHGQFYVLETSYVGFGIVFGL